jgi:EF hand
MKRLMALAGIAFAAAVGRADEPVRHRGEFLQMWDAIVAGSQMGPGDGWFKPAQTRYTWDRLKARADKNRDDRITAAEFDGPAELFAVLDRDGDGAITADDLDWSDNTAYARQLSFAQQFLRQGDANGDRKLSKEEWNRLFEKAAKGKDSLDAETVRRLLYPPPPPRPPKSPGGGMPPKEVLLLGLLTGEIGSGAEGPKLEATAPDFTLQTPDGKKTITLDDYREKKPVALIFGSFT